MLTGIWLLLLCLVAVAQAMPPLLEKHQAECTLVEQKRYAQSLAPVSGIFGVLCIFAVYTCTHTFTVHSHTATVVVFRVARSRTMRAYRIIVDVTLGNNSRRQRQR